MLGHPSPRCGFAYDEIGGDKDAACRSVWVVHAPEKCLECRPGNLLARLVHCSERRGYERCQIDIIHARQQNILRAALLDLPQKSQLVSTHAPPNARGSAKRQR